MGSRAVVRFREERKWMGVRSRGNEDDGEEHENEEEEGIRVD